MGARERGGHQDQRGTWRYDSFTRERDMNEGNVPEAEDNPSSIDIGKEGEEAAKEGEHSGSLDVDMDAGEQDGNQGKGGTEPGLQTSSPAKDSTNSGEKRKYLTREAKMMTKDELPLLPKPKPKPRPKPKPKPRPRPKGEPGLKPRS
jgi:hypothetical protein